MEEHSVVWQLIRAARVLDGIGAQPTTDGVLVPGCACGILVSWPEIARLLQDDDPVHPAPRRRLALLLELRRAASAPGAAGVLGQAARPLALPAGHPLHPGPAWVRERIPGGVLDVGLGVSRLLPGQDGVVPLPPEVAEAAGLAQDDVWSQFHDLSERLASFAIDRAEASAAGAVPRVLAGVGGCDALTLLALAPVRAWLTGRATGEARAIGEARATGEVFAAVSAPCRERVWIGPAAGDQDYVRAVWMLTTPVRRGVLEPLTVTADAVGARLEPGVRSAASGPRAPHPARRRSRPRGGTPPGR